MGKLEFVDAHVHFYDMQHPELFYGHWQSDADPPVIGKQMQKLGERNFLAEDFIEIKRASNVTKAVHVQAAIGSEDPVKETEWLEEAAERTGFPHAIVAHADLRAPDVEALLERHCEFPRMRGVRDFSYGDFLVSEDFHRGYALLENYNLHASIAAQWQDIEKLVALANKFPNTIIVIDHAGNPAERNEEYFEQWKRGMATAATAENIICKISGLGMGDHNWTVESIRPYVLSCIEAFGVPRSIFATNWPVDSLFSRYDTLIDAYTEIVSDFSDDEKRDLFARNTEALYRI